MKKKAMLIAVLLVGCTTELGYVNPQPDRTMAQRDAAMKVCIDAAEKTQDSPSRIITNVLLGSTIVGIPAAGDLRRAEMRQVFATCMKERGFTVTPPQ